MAYDTCFNHWFKSYLILISPPLSTPASTPAGAEEREARARTIQAKRDEYERECGSKYQEYQKCVWAGIKKADGLKEMVEKARKEDPLTGWGEIKVVKEEDLRG